MELTGTLKDISKDWISGKYSITFSVDENIDQSMVDGIKESKLSIKAVRYREKRSLNANAYFHVLTGKIAEALTISKAHAKNVLICRYGQPETLPDGSFMIYKTNAPVEYMQELETIHSIPVRISEENGKEVIFYKIYRGSHTYNTKEMSLLIDGTVSDAKELGIETLTPDEIERMKNSWNQYCNH